MRNKLLKFYGVIVLIAVSFCSVISFSGQEPNVEILRTSSVHAENNISVTEPTVNIIAKNTEFIVECETEVPTEFVNTIEPSTEPIAEFVEQNDNDIIEEFEEVVGENDNIENSYLDDLAFYEDRDYYNTILRASVSDYSEWDTIGYFSCPAVGLYDIPIIYGFSQSVCDNSDICMDSWAVDKNNHLFGDALITRICGHNYKALSALSTVTTGMDIYVTTVYGGNYHYRVCMSKVLTQSQDSEHFYGYYDETGEFVIRPWESNTDLVVFTCYDMGVNDYRWVVRANLIKGTTFC